MTTQKLLNNTIPIHEKPAWRFAPTMGGAEQGANPGEMHFTAGALEAMVRETLQNSLDHHDHNLPPVQVTYQMTQVNPGDVNAQELAEHAAACLEEEGEDPDVRKRFKVMLENLNQTEIPCLAVIDANTTGLRGSNWENLIFKEGIPSGEGNITKGGSFGFGKNAPFNLSSTGTVIYSTRYLTQQGKVTKVAGRAQLRSHHNPGKPGERLQNIGFLAGHQEEDWNQPIMGPEIPQAFHLDESGTGVYILGFNQSEYPDWQKQIARAAVGQFFAAIQMERLTISIESQGKTKKIGLQTIEEEIEALPENDHRTKYYYRAFREAEATLTNPSGRMNGMRGLKLWISTEREAPNRLAHINRRGMLITDSRERKDNPLYPRGGTTWAAWCALTMAGDEKTDAFLRKMEPPAHDALQTSQLREQNDRDTAIQEMETHRGQIRNLVRDALNQSHRKNSTNIEELAKLFPITGRTPGSDLEFHERKLPVNPDQPIEHEDDGTNTVGGSAGTGGGARGGTGRGGNNQGKGDPKPTVTKLGQTRILRTGPQDLVMAFTAPQDQQHDDIRFSLRAAGEQYQRNETPIQIGEIVQVGDITARARLDGENIVVTAPPGTRVKLMISLDEKDASYQSYQLALAEKRHE